MQQKVQFLAAIIHKPELIILDEPFSGLDPVNAMLLHDLIRELHDEGRTILFSTHVLHQAERPAGSRGRSWVGRALLLEVRSIRILLF